MDPQTEKEPAPHKKTPPGWLWWSLLGAGLYVLDQASKLWIIRRFPLNYLNEKLMLEQQPGQRQMVIQPLMPLLVQWCRDL